MRSHRVVSLAAVLALTAGGLSACSQTPKAQPGSAGSTAPAATSAPESQPATKASEQPSTEATTSAPAPTADPADPNVLTLTFVGDMHFEKHVRALVGDPESLASLKETAVGRSDLAFGNLETAITERGKKEPKTYTFHAAPAVLTALDNAGFDALTMANNHAVDFGPDGLEDTLSTRETAPLPLGGIGRNVDDAYQAISLEAKGVRVGMIAADQIDDETTLKKYSATADKPGVADARDTARLVEAVKAARSDHDVVVVFLHWGVERSTCASGKQKTTAAALEAAGADVIVGAHAHKPQGGGWLGKSYVGWGLGNFVWWNWEGSDYAKTGTLTLDVDVNAAKARNRAQPIVTGARWEPMIVSRSGVPRPVRDGAERKTEEARWAAAVRCSGLRQER